jgi:hypothetical protein
MSAGLWPALMAAGILPARLTYGCGLEVRGPQCGQDARAHQLRYN